MRRVNPSRSRIMLSIVFLACLGAVGCKANSEQKPGGQDNAAAAKIRILLATISRLELEISSRESQRQCQQHLLGIHDQDLDEPGYVDYYIEVPANLSLIKKMRIVAKELSTRKFDGAPIVVKRIETRKGKKVAVVELTQVKKASGMDTWHPYFQGSAGGGITEYQLVETLLQRLYKGQWVDAVEFFYGGKSLVTDHMEMSGPVFR